MALARGALGLLFCSGLGGALAMGGCASRQVKPDEQVVKSLRISGNHAISSGKIESKILTRATGWWPFATKRLFDPVAWRADLDRIVRMYGARGYYQTTIAKQDVAPRPPNAVALTVEVHEGEPTHIGQIDFRGLDGLPEKDREAATGRLPIAVGRVFQEDAWAEAKEKIRSVLRNRGYARAALDGVALVDVATQKATLTINVRPGKIYKFGEIRVDTRPGSRVPAPIIWDQVRIAIPQGAKFNDDAIEEARRRLVAMAVFATPVVAAGTPDDATGLVPVEVSVQEAPFRTLRLGGGLYFDQARNEIRGLAEWTNRDFMGGLRRLTVRAEAGWAFIPDLYSVLAKETTVVTRQGPIALLGLELEQPRLFHRPTLRWKNLVSAQRSLEQTYAQAGAAITTGIVWAPWTRFSIFPAYHIELDHLSGAPVSSAATAPLTLGCHTTNNECFVWLSYLEQAVVWDRRSTPLEPRSGWYLGLSVQEGGGPLGGNFSYVRVLPDLRGYISFLDNAALTLAARVEVGELWTASGDPESSAVVTRFYAGGAVSMRGFGERRLSPLLLAPAPANPSVEITVPIGGNGLIDGSFETRYSVSNTIRVAGFVDFGQVTTGLLTASDLPTVLWAVGAGLRYITPIGPIRADLAVRLPFGDPPPLYTTDTTGAIVQVPSYPVNNNCFGLFGSHPATPVTDSLCVVSISIGEAF